MISKTPTNPVKAIRHYCLTCSGNSPAEVKSCTVEACELFPFRLGKNPYRKRTPASSANRLHANKPPIPATEKPQTHQSHTKTRAGK